jgi:6-phosphofructo-2-kinase/fructose-2,6-biphosphatase 4
MAELGYKVIQRQQMHELNPGDVDGLSPEQLKEKYPEEWARSEKDPYAHRYPRAESYHDLSVRCVPVVSAAFDEWRHVSSVPGWDMINLLIRMLTLPPYLLNARRLEPVILELEREPADILFIGHGSVIRCIMAYLAVRFVFRLPLVSPLLRARAD